MFWKYFGLGDKVSCFKQGAMLVWKPILSETLPKIRTLMRVHSAENFKNSSNEEAKATNKHMFLKKKIRESNVFVNNIGS